MIKTLHLEGDYFEIGTMHGQLGKKEVHQSLETYESLFYGYSNITWKQAKEEALLHLNAIEKYDENLLHEMDGVAKGAGVEFEDILALNARSEIALANYGGARFADGCTAIGVSSPLSKDTIIGQNWDWKASQTKSLLLVTIVQEGKPTIKMITEGGIIGKIGFNAAGVGVCLNALLTNKRTSQIPIHLGLRSVLNSTSLNEAISRVKDGQMASTANFLIGSDEGNGNVLVGNIEVSPYGIDFMGATEGKITHTNHICSSEIKKNIEDRNEFIHEDSMLRKYRAELLLNTAIHQNREINEEVFKEWLSDRFNYPNSISHYVNERAPEHRRMETVFSVIMNLTKQKMELCVGKPSENRYVHV